MEHGLVKPKVAHSPRCWLNWQVSCALVASHFVAPPSRRRLFVQPTASVVPPRY